MKLCFERPYEWTTILRQLKTGRPILGPGTLNLAQDYGY